MKLRRLPAGRLRFAREFVANGGRGRAAAIAAGYAPRSAAVTASRLLCDDIVLSVIADLLDKKAPGADEALRRLLMPCRPAVVKRRLQIAMNYPLVMSILGTGDNLRVLVDAEETAMREFVAREADRLGLPTAPKIEESTAPGANSRCQSGENSPKPDDPLGLFD